MYRGEDVLLVVGRTASLPAEVARRLLEVEAFEDLDFKSMPFARHCDAIERALRVSSASMAAAFARWRQLGIADARFKASLASYLLRMATRTTPFGLCASVGIVSVGESTDLSIEPTGFRTHYQVDMSWLLPVIRSLEGDVEVAAGLRYYSNKFIVRRGERIYIEAPDAPTNDGSQPSSRVDEPSLRASPLVAQILQATQSGASVEDIMKRVGSLRGKPRADVIKLIIRLREAGLIISSLRRSPLSTMFDSTVHGTSGVLEIGRQLREINSAIGRLNAASHDDDTMATLENVSARCDELHVSKHHVQVDLTHEFRGSISRQMADDAARLADVWMRSSPPYTLKNYAERFIDRFESSDTLVPLLDLVDDSRGIGPPPERFEKDRDVAGVRVAAMSRLVVRSLRRGELEVCPSISEIEECVGPPCAVERIPEYFDVSISVAYQGGRYVLGPGSGAAPGAAKFSRRFADQLPGLCSSFPGASDEGGPLHVELVYMPRTDRSGNICRVPSGGAYEMNFGVTPASSHARVIDPADVVVGLVDGRFVVWSTRLRRQLMFSQPHLLNPGHSIPDAVRFLCLLETQGKQYPAGFDWGVALQLLPMTPRVRVNNLVIALAQWRMPASMFSLPDADMQRAIDAWRHEHLLPDVACLQVDDITSPVCFTTKFGLERLRRLATRVQGRTLHFIEMFPDPDAYWVKVNDEPRKVDLSFTFGSAGRFNAESRRFREPVRVKRDFDQTSGCAYFKYYCHPSVIDDLLVHHVHPAVCGAQERNGNLKWFFVRYEDPLPHVRVRIIGSDADSIEIAHRALRDIGGVLLEQRTIESYGTDTYHREFERYGGPDCFGDVESLFEASSAAAVAALPGLRADYDERVRQTIRTFHPILCSLLSPTDIRRFIGGFARRKRRLTAPERRTARSLQGEFQLGSPPGPTSGNRLRVACQEGKLTRTLPDIAASLLHMHCNRMGIPAGGEERVVVDIALAIYLGLLQRAAPAVEKAAR